ncbi:MAG: glutamate--tRNA ligase [FCB group bacterium]|nr:glutamate--tRNA ligase [FCB group bacterium]
MSPKPVRVRFAPSPTGDFHVGGARTALFNYLFARHHNGSFILRIEDTDRKRFNPQAMQWLLDGLRYLGLEWDEGPEVGGDYGPYVQSERLDLYRRNCQKLIDNRQAYYCFCTPERLKSVSLERQKQGLDPGYDRHCRNIDFEEAAQKVRDGATYTVRFKIPRDGKVIVKDLIRGEIEFDNAVLRDAVLLKSDGTPTYHLANVIDDHHMEISHILRGDEWVSSLPLHWHLYRAFGWEPPVMAHLPIILNPTGKGKMSKREQRAPDGKILPVFVRTFKELGYLPEALVNYLALLGWSVDDKTEFMTREELIEHFSLERINTSPAAWNYEKLLHFNGHYIRQLSIPELTDRLLPYLSAAGIKSDREKMLRITPLIQERLNVLSEVAEKVDFFFVEQLPDYDPRELIPKKGDVQMALLALQKAAEVLSDIPFTRDQIENVLRESVRSLGLKAGQMFQPVRVAVCGRKVAPPLFQTLEILGPEVALERIRLAIDKLQSQRV